MRIDMRIDDRSPLATVLAGLPAGSRAKVLRAIAEAALIPGGWARIVGDQVVLSGAATPASTPKPTMQAQEAAIDLFKKFGALDDDD